jgi:hypothetical protein
VAEDVRAGDADRERVARVLREHWAEGRLDIAEFDARVGTVYAASTRRELDAVLADLPRSSAAGDVAQARLWWPGTATFQVERHLRSPPPVAYQDALRIIVPRMSMAGFVLASEVPPRRLEFRASDELHVGVLLHLANDGGTVLAAFGEAPRKVRKAFATLED